MSRGSQLARSTTSSTGSAGAPRGSHTPSRPAPAPASHAPGTAAAVRSNQSLREQFLYILISLQFRGGILGDRGQMEFYGIFLNFRFYRTRLRVVWRPQTDLAITARNAHASVVGPP